MGSNSSFNSPQNDIPSEKVFKWWDYLVFILLSVLNFAGIFYFLSHWFSFRDWVQTPVTFSIMSLLVLLMLSNNQGRWFLLLWMKKPRPTSRTKPGWKVAVVTSFVPHAESTEMLERTVRSLKALDYPHDTWVLDEGDDAQVKSICHKLGANHFSRKHFQNYQTESGIFQSRSKHGNYNSWCYEIGFDQYDFITTFDPDHVPVPAFLENVLPYFEYPMVGYVQTAQAYYNQKASFIARGAAEETYSYFSSVQMASFGMGYPIIVGCHNTHRVSALKQVGGFAAHDAEDLLLTLHYRGSGWKGVYVPQILARGLTPVDWSGYLDQQRRWARSVLDIKFRIYPKIAKNLSFPTRVISFLHGINYLHKSLVILACILLLGFMLSTGVMPQVISFLTLGKLAVLSGIFQVSEFYRQRFYLDWQNECGLHWRAGLLHFAKWPYFVGAFLDVIRNRKFPYVLTPKLRSGKPGFKLLRLHLPVIVFITVAWIVGLISGRTIDPILKILAGTVVIGSLALIFSEFMSFPPPYDENLRISSPGRPLVSIEERAETGSDL